MSLHRDIQVEGAEYRFGFACSYMGRAEYTVYDRSGRKVGIMAYRPRAASEYERETYNGDPAELDKELGLVWWAYDPLTPMDPAVVSDFYAYQLANFEAARARFGADLVPDSERPTYRIAGCYVHGVGFTTATHARRLAEKAEESRCRANAAALACYLGNVS